MKKCKMCGSFLSNNATVCPRCGVEVKDDIEPIKVEPVMAYNEENQERDEKKETNVNFCPSCGAKVEEGSRFCPKCGRSLVEETPHVEVVENYSNNDAFTMDMEKLNGEYAKKASTNLTLAIVSIILCCCSIPAIISLVMSILSLSNLGKLDENVKNTTEYRSIKNKNIIALVLAAFATFMWITSLIENIMNPVDYDELYNSLFNELENAGV